MPINPDNVSIINIPDLGNASGLSDSNYMIVGQGIYARKETLGNFRDYLNLNNLENNISDLQYQVGQIETSINSVVLFTTQTLSNAQQTQARANINALDLRMANLPSNLTTAEKDSIIEKLGVNGSINGKVSKSGDTMSGALNIQSTESSGDSGSTTESLTYKFFISNNGTAYGIKFGVYETGKGFIQAGRNDSNVPYDLILNPLGGNVIVKTGTQSDHAINLGQLSNYSNIRLSNLVADLSTAEKNAINTKLGLTAYVPTSRTITINGVTQDLSANRTFTVGGSDYTIPLKKYTVTTNGTTIGITSERTVFVNFLSNNPTGTVISNPTVDGVELVMRRQQTGTGTISISLTHELNGVNSSSFAMDKGSEARFIFDQSIDKWVNIAYYYSIT